MNSYDGSSSVGTGGHLGNDVLSGSNPGCRLLRVYMKVVKVTNRENGKSLLGESVHLFGPNNDMTDYHIEYGVYLSDEALKEKLKEAFEAGYTRACNDCDFGISEGDEEMSRAYEKWSKEK